MRVFKIAVLSVWCCIFVLPHAAAQDVGTSIPDKIPSQPIVSMQEGNWPIEHITQYGSGMISNFVWDKNPCTGQVVIAYAYERIVNVVDNKGFSLPGWPVLTFGLPGEVKFYDIAKPVIGDIDGDENLEVLAFTQTPGPMNDIDHVLAWHIENGKPVQGWPLVFPDDLGGIALSDLDNDNDMEVIIARSDVGTGETIVFAVQGDCSLYAEWPVIADADIDDKDHTSISTADLDCDGYKEVIITFGYMGINTMYPSPICVFDHNGELKWMKIMDGYVRAACVGNIDDDPELEIAVMYRFEDPSDYPWKSGTTVLEYDGTTSPGWSPKIWYDSYEMVVGDIDLDNKMEILVGNSRLIAYDNDGTVKWENKYASVRSNLIIGDILGDDKPEIVYGSYLYKAKALNSDGEVVLTFPYPNDLENYSIAMGDIDEDGDVELLTWLFGHGSHFAVSKLCAWDLPFKSNPDSMEWPMYRHDAQHSGYNPD